MGANIASRSATKSGLLLALCSAILFASQIQLVQSGRHPFPAPPPTAFVQQFGIVAPQLSYGQLPVGQFVAQAAIHPHSDHHHLQHSRERVKRLKTKLNDRVRGASTKLLHPNWHAASHKGRPSVAPENAAWLQQAQFYPSQQQVAPVYYVPVAAAGAHEFSPHQQQRYAATAAASHHYVPQQVHQLPVVVPLHQAAGGYFSQLGDFDNYNYKHDTRSNSYHSQGTRSSKQSKRYMISKNSKRLAEERRRIGRKQSSKQQPEPSRPRNVQPSKSNSRYRNNDWHNRHPHASSKFEVGGERFLPKNKFAETEASSKLHEKASRKPAEEGQHTRNLEELEEDGSGQHEELTSEEFDEHLVDDEQKKREGDGGEASAHIDEPKINLPLVDSLRGPEVTIGEPPVEESTTSTAPPEPLVDPKEHPIEGAQVEAVEPTGLLEDSKQVEESEEHVESPIPPQVEAEIDERKNEDEFTSSQENRSEPVKSFDEQNGAAPTSGDKVEEESEPSPVEENNVVESIGSPIEEHSETNGGNNQNKKESEEHHISDQEDEADKVEQTTPPTRAEDKPKRKEGEPSYNEETSKLNEVEADKHEDEHQKEEERDDYSHKKHEQNLPSPAEVKASESTPVPELEATNPPNEENAHQTGSPVGGVDQVANDEAVSEDEETKPREAPKEEDESQSTAEHVEQFESTNELPKSEDSHDVAEPNVIEDDEKPEEDHKDNLTTDSQDKATKPEKLEERREVEVEDKNDAAALVGKVSEAGKVGEKLVDSESVKQSEKIEQESDNLIEVSVAKHEEEQNSKEEEEKSDRIEEAVHVDLVEPPNSHFIAAETKKKEEEKEVSKVEKSSEVGEEQSEKEGREEPTKGGDDKSMDSSEAEEKLAEADHEAETKEHPNTVPSRAEIEESAPEESPKKMAELPEANEPKENSPSEDKSDFAANVTGEDGKHLEPKEEPPKAVESIKEDSQSEKPEETPDVVAARTDEHHKAEDQQPKADELTKENNQPEKAEETSEPVDTAIAEDDKHSEFERKTQDSDESAKEGSLLGLDAAATATGEGEKRMEPRESPNTDELPEGESQPENLSKLTEIVATATDEGQKHLGSEEEAPKVDESPEESVYREENDEAKPSTIGGGEQVEGPKAPKEGDHPLEDRKFVDPTESLPPKEGEPSEKVGEMGEGNPSEASEAVDGHQQADGQSEEATGELPPPMGDDKVDDQKAEEKKETASTEAAPPEADELSEESVNEDEDLSKKDEDKSDSSEENSDELSQDEVEEFFDSLGPDENTFTKVETARYNLTPKRAGTSSEPSGRRKPKRIEPGKNEVPAVRKRPMILQSNSNSNRVRVEPRISLTMSSAPADKHQVRKPLVRRGKKVAGWPKKLKRNNGRT